MGIKFNVSDQTDHEGDRLYINPWLNSCLCYNRAGRVRDDMGEKRSESIFDFAGKRCKPLPKKREESVAPRAPPPAQEAAVSTSEASDMDALRKEVRQKQDELNRRLDDAYSSLGHTRDSLKDFLDNPNNFSDTVWKSLKQQREEYEQKINQMIGSEATQQLKQTAKRQEETKRKGKSVGFRRNWLSM